MSVLYEVSALLFVLSAYTVYSDSLFGMRHHPSKWKINKHGKSMKSVTATLVYLECGIGPSPLRTWSQKCNLERFYVFQDCQLTIWNMFFGWLDIGWLCCDFSVDPAIPRPCPSCSFRCVSVSISCGSQSLQGWIIAARMQGAWMSQEFRING